MFAGQERRAGRCCPIGQAARHADRMLPAWRAPRP